MAERRSASALTLPRNEDEVQVRLGRRVARDGFDLAKLT